MLKENGFDLIKWKSNRNEVLEVIIEDYQAEMCAPLSGSDPDGKSVLGMIWNVSSGCFKLNINVPDKLLTRRELLSNAEFIV